MVATTAFSSLNDVPEGYSATSSAVFPFPVSEDIASLNGPSYGAPQTLIELTSYALSDAIFTYSPESFELDAAVSAWKSAQQTNAFGAVPLLSNLETRAGAGSLPLGYIFSTTLPRTSDQAPRSILASSGSLPSFAPILNELAYLSKLPSPIVFNVAAIDYSPVSQAFVPDYVTALNIARDSNLALVTSSKVNELQHMTLFSSLLATVLPSVHLYDGFKLNRENQRIIDVLGVRRVKDIFEKVLNEQDLNFHRNDTPTKASKLLTSLNAELGTSYRLFEYEGHDQPEVVLVILGSTEAAIATEVALKLSDAGERVGVLAVRVAAPFVDSQFLNAIPRTTKQILVFGQVYGSQDVQDSLVQSALYSDVFAAVIMSSVFPAGSRPKLIDFKYTREQLFTPKNFVWIYEQLIKGVPATAEIPESIIANNFSTVASFDLLHGQEISQYVFWNSDDSALATAPAKLAQLLSLDSSYNVGFTTTFDNQTLSGIVQSELRLSKRSIDVTFPVTNANVVVVNEEKILSSYNVLDSLKYNGSVLIDTASSFEELAPKVPVQIKKAIVDKQVTVHTINLSAITQTAGDSVLATVAAQLAFLAVARPHQSVEDYLGKIASLNYISEPPVSTIAQISDKIAEALVKVEIPTTWDLTIGDEKHLPGLPVTDSFTANDEKFAEEPVPEVQSWQEAAKRIAFKEAYGYETSLRPDLPVQNFVAKVQELKRLTPLEYDRNIFHIEFDITGTGLKYEIGEALGVHGQNDKQAVEEFITAYGLNPEQVVLTPSRDDPAISEYRTVFQVLLENLDIFGKTPKKFYEGLVEFATDEKQKAHLQKLGSSAGSEEFKRRSDEETLTYADVLLEFDSARPSVEDLIRIVNPLKRREYSIASSQKVHPNAVHLLIVVVDWVDKRGRKRYGQCSKYISELSIGSEVVVSVKPSVMKLPPSSEQPIILSGLGTGLAPFKAFVEEKVYQKQQGLPIGEIYLFLGSRHQKEEYLYGEFWEAMKDAGVITHIGAAFSRDQPQKIYIQDRMRESIGELAPAFINKQGVLYLCGPTWPVPDITAVLEDIITRDAEAREVTVDAAKEVEELKEKSRYILEVY
ncbi:hypothetical protein V1514DRAFT_13011 [Lipomyces japonicus]|uniref:uncharacterized protein n=1 Tax=Lipomyces japonicus TaxID=56871 RepID=UPI0034CF8069